MEYPFKDLLPREETTARQGYYKDWTHIDANTFHQISELVKFVREKGYGADTREAIAQSLERVYHDAAKSGNANMEVSMARRGYSTLAESLGNLSVNMINKNLGKLDQTYMSDELLAQIAGDAAVNAVPKPKSLTTDKYSDSSVTPEVTSFATGGGGINLWDGRYYNVVPAGNPPHQVVTQNERLSVIVKLDGNTAYTFQKSSDTDRFRIALFDTYPDLLVTPTRFFEHDNSTSATLTTTDSEVYALVQVSGSLYPPKEFQVEKGVTKSDYVSPDLVNINLDTGSFSEILEKSNKNLFDGRYYRGSLAGVAPNSLNKTDAYHALYVGKPNTTYTFSKSPDTDRFRFGLFTSKPKYGDTPSAYYEPDGHEYTLSTTDDAIYIVAVVSSSASPAKPSWFQIEESSTFTSYEPPYYFKPTMLKVTGLGNVNFEVNKFINDYTPITSAPVMDSTLTSHVIYDWFDDFVTRYPSDWSRDLLTTEPTGRPIYIYKYTPPKISGGVKETFPNILHIGGIHGNEKQNLASMMRFYKDMMDNWHDSRTLRDLRFNTTFTIIPCFNVWGCDNHSRLNSNGVNLNRNFPLDFTYSDVPYDASGPHALSEVEAQALMAYLQSNDFTFAIDCHTYNPYANDNYTIWTGTRNYTTNKYLSAWSRNIQGDFYKMHGDLVGNNRHLVRVLEDFNFTRKGTLSTMFDVLGIPGTIFEISFDTAFNDFHTIALADLLGTALSYLHNDKTKWL